MHSYGFLPAISEIRILISICMQTQTFFCRCCCWIFFFCIVISLIYSSFAFYSTLSCVRFACFALLFIFYFLFIFSFVVVVFSVCMLPNLWSSGAELNFLKLSTSSIFFVFECFMFFARGLAKAYIHVYTYLYNYWLYINLYLMYKRLSSYIATACSN